MGFATLRCAHAMMAVKQQHLPSPASTQPLDPPGGFGMCFFTAST